MRLARGCHVDLPDIVPTAPKGHFSGSTGPIRRKMCIGCAARFLFNTPWLRPELIGSGTCFRVSHLSPRLAQRRIRPCRWSEPACLHLSPAGRWPQTTTQRARCFRIGVSIPRARARACQRINRTLSRADQIEHAEAMFNTTGLLDRCRCRGRLRRSRSTRTRDHEGVHRSEAAAVHFQDQLASRKKPSGWQGAHPDRRA